MHTCGTMKLSTLLLLFYSVIVYSFAMNSASSHPVKDFASEDSLEENVWEGKERSGGIGLEKGAGESSIAGPLNHKLVNSEYPKSIIKRDLSRFLNSRNPLHNAFSSNPSRNTNNYRGRPGDDVADYEGPGIGIPDDFYDDSEIESEAEREKVEKVVEINWDHKKTAFKPSRKTEDKGSKKGPIGPKMDVNSANQVPVCEGSTYCEDTPFYPVDTVKDLIANKSDLKLTIDKVYHDKVSRTDTSEFDMCMSEEKVIFPKTAENERGDWAYIINDKNTMQGVRVEICKYENKECELVGEMTGYSTFCKQKYIYRELIAMSKDGVLVTQRFKFPASCCCVGKDTF